MRGFGRRDPAQAASLTPPAPPPASRTRTTPYGPDDRGAVPSRVRASRLASHRAARGHAPGAGQTARRGRGRESGGGGAPRRRASYRETPLDDAREGGLRRGRGRVCLNLFRARETAASQVLGELGASPPERAGGGRPDSAGRPRTGTAERGRRLRQPRGRALGGRRL